MNQKEQVRPGDIVRSNADYRSSRRTLIGAMAGAVVASRFGVEQAIARTNQASAESSSPAKQISVYPSPNTRTASPYTEISFRGITRDELGPVDVEGSESGGNSGILKDHADGNGVSYLPDARFEPGELVTVKAGVPITKANGGILRFHVGQPAALIEATTEETVDDPKVDTHSFRSRPDLKPPVMKTTTTGDVAPGMIFLAAKTPEGQNGCMIIDNDGEPIWFGLPPVDDYVLYDFRVQRLHDEPVLTWYEGVRARGFGRGHYVIANASYERINEFQVGNGLTDGGDLHEFKLTSRGTALVTIYYIQHWDLSPVGGSMFGTAHDCVVQEIEIETGRVLFEWHALDHVGLEESKAAGNPDGEDVLDYFHLNSIQELKDGNFLISARHTHAIYKIDRHSGEIIWRLNGTRSDFTMGPATKFAWQHDAQIHANGELSLFDNHAANDSREEQIHSRGLVLALDHDQMAANLLRQYVHPEEVLSPSQGNMQVLPNENVFIGWGSEPVFTEFSHDGVVTFEGRFPDGGGSYRAFRNEWKGQPGTPPDVSVETVGRNEATVFASWNGATEVATWQVVAGPSKDSMAAVATASRDGFETTIAVKTMTNYYAVRALNAAGEVIGTAAPVQPRSDAVHESDQIEASLLRRASSNLSFRSRSSAHDAI